jgi:hypothetical protein
MTERFVVDVGDHDPRDWEPPDRPDPSEYEDPTDPEPTTFVEVTYSDGTRARWALCLQHEDSEDMLDKDLIALLGQPHTILT